MFSLFSHKKSLVGITLLFFFFQSGTFLAQCGGTVVISTGTTSQCNLSATVIPGPNFCSASYSWQTGSTVSVSGASLCPGTTYTLQLYSGFSGSTCCPPQVISFTVPPAPSCSLNAQHTATLLQNGVGSLVSISSGTNASSSYTWCFGDGSCLQTGTNAQVSHTYMLNGTYTTSMIVSNNNLPNCRDTSYFVLNVNNVPCNLIANYGFTMINDTTVSFNNISTGTVSNTTYTWNFGDGDTTSVASPIHYYHAPGIYQPTLTARNNPQCTDVNSAYNITVTPSTCSLIASFTASMVSNLTVRVKSTSTGTTSASTYTYSFGDGSSGYAPNLLKTYNSIGIYTITLKIIDTVSGCFAISSNTVFVDTLNCNIHAAFLHTVGAAGTVSFSSLVPPNGFSFFWNFGDGYSAVDHSPVHQYYSSGTYLVSHMAYRNGYELCSDTVKQALNVTGAPCIATAGFSITPTNVPKLWSATPFYPYNVIAAVWDWGNGHTTEGLYSSYVYTVSGNYNICLSVTVSCGATSKFCLPYFFSKPAGDNGANTFSVNIYSPPLKMNIAESQAVHDVLQIFPNPNKGTFTIQYFSTDNKTLNLSLYDVLGRLSKQIVIETNTEEKFNAPELSSGIYFLRIEGSTLPAKKIIITE